MSKANALTRHAHRIIADARITPEDVWDNTQEWSADGVPPRVVFRPTGTVHDAVEQYVKKLSSSQLGYIIGQSPVRPDSHCGFYFAPRSGHGPFGEALLTMCDHSIETALDWLQFGACDALLCALRNEVPKLAPQQPQPPQQPEYRKVLSLS